MSTEKSVTHIDAHLATRASTTTASGDSADVASGAPTDSLSSTDASWGQPLPFVPDALPPFNQRLVNSMFTLSTLVGLSVAQLTQGTIVGNLGFSEIAFPKPLFHGDTLYAETVIVEKRASKSRPGEGIVTFAHTGRNQHGDVVATANRKTMVRMQPPEAAGGRA